MDGNQRNDLGDLNQKVNYLLHMIALDQQRGDEARINQGRILTELYRARSGRRLADYEFKVFSQWGEDGIIQRLIHEVPLAHRTFIEFGVEDFMESNCRYLLMNDNWQGMVLDGSTRNIETLRASYFFWKHDLQAVAAFITAENIDALLAKAGFESDLGLLSVDVDGVDFWILQAVECVQPRILVVEYNSLFGPERIITVPYEADFQRTRKHHSNLYYGASLGAMTALATVRGYDLVGTNSAGSNAFFVRRDVRPESLPALAVEQAFNPCWIREARDAQGRLTYASRGAQLDMIRGLPVFNIATGQIEPL
jgi:hypothetical protein